MTRVKTIIMGAAGRDFHNFNVRFRNDATREVVAFTATQIPYIVGRLYPPALAGPLYPSGIPIYGEEELPQLIERLGVREVYFAYSDVSYEHVMQSASVVQAAGADFIVPNPQQTMLAAHKPVVSVGAVRTGCGKSQTTRAIARILKGRGLKVAIVRHPMPYGDLAAQRCQRFEHLEDLAAHHCTLEEMEEYEPHLTEGFLVFAGVDYGDILARAQEAADVIVWDGGNNDLPFFKSNLHVVVCDPHRVGHERRYYPGELNARLADVFVINKEDSASRAAITTLEASLKRLNAKAQVVHADSAVTVDHAAAVAGKRVLCIEDGPTLTHGEMEFGAAVVAARRLGAAEVVDPRPWLQGALKATFEAYPGIGPLLPAMGYSEEQRRDLGRTIDRVDCDLVLVGTPVDLARIVKFNKPAARVRYELQEKPGGPSLHDIIDARLF